MTQHLIFRSLVSATALFLLTLGACTADTPSSNNSATGVAPGLGDACDLSGQECADGLTCVAGVCEEASDAGVEDEMVEPPRCDDERPLCGNVCCDAEEVCEANRCVEVCESGLVCEGVCCDSGQVCEEGLCLAPCETTRCGEELSLCCDAQEVCFGNACITPGGTCLRTEDCALGEICEPGLGRCLSRDAINVCEFRPPIGEFSPTLGCRWTAAGLEEFPNRGDVVATPIVLNLSDDNGDGQTNTDDVPDLAFLSYDLLNDGCCNREATLRIVRGECEGEGMLTLASISEPSMDNSSGLAGGDLNNDGVPEVVAVGMFHTNDNGRKRPQGVIAWERVGDDGRDWRVLWVNETYPTHDVHTRGGALISLADLEGDGQPEVVVGNVVLNGQDGTLKWDGVETSGGVGGIGNNAFLGPYAAVADIDLDGQREVIAGNTLYSADGTPRWTFDYGTESNSGCAGNLPCDGYAAVANFDDDPEGEVVIVRLGEVFVLEHTGELRWRQAIPVDDCNNNESGPPTVADFDGDGRAEIGTAAADFYAVLDLDCDRDPVPSSCASRGVLWAVPNEDCSSRVTASSVFDFEGDGRAEMIYADEVSLRIFDGTTGAVLFEDDTHGSHTRIEMPVVVDVDNDGNSEIIIPENGSNGGTSGLEVFKDASDNWVRTRRIWNQHAYSVTNVTEDGRLPATPSPNWANNRLNNFRQNVQPGGLFDAPDLVVRALEADTSRCGNALELTLTVTIANDGALAVAPGVPVIIAAGEGQERRIIRALETSARLLPGQSERFSVTWVVPDELPDTFVIEATIDPQMQINECVETNNALAQEVTCAIIR